MMNAYDKDYLYHAQKNLGHMVDFAINTCDYDLDVFFDMFLASSVPEQFENGNPAYIAGKTGPELVRIIVLETRDKYIDEIDVMYLDKSPEYWLGWALCFYAWKNNYKFKHILKAVPPEDMICMYDTHHEADISKYSHTMDERLSAYYRFTALHRIRNSVGMSQSELAKRSGVNVRIIQSYEQKQRDISKAQMSTVSNLAHALNCKMEDLLV